MIGLVKSFLTSIQHQVILIVDRFSAV